MDEHERKRRLVHACQELARKLWHQRKRIAAAATYCDEQLADRPDVRDAVRKAWRHIDQLAFIAFEIAGSPWPGKIPCPHCGAPPEIFGANQKPNPAGGSWLHVPVHFHYDGKQCEDDAPK